MGRHTAANFGLVMFLGRLKKFTKRHAWWGFQAERGGIWQGGVGGVPLAGLRTPICAAALPAQDRRRAMHSKVPGDDRG